MSLSSQLRPISRLMAKQKEQGESVETIRKMRFRDSITTLMVASSSSSIAVEASVAVPSEALGLVLLAMMLARQAAKRERHVAALAGVEGEEVKVAAEGAAKVVEASAVAAEKVAVAAEAASGNGAVNHQQMVRASSKAAAAVVAVSVAAASAEAAVSVAAASTDQNLTPSQLKAAVAKKLLKAVRRIARVAADVAVSVAEVADAEDSAAPIAAGVANLSVTPAL